MRPGQRFGLSEIEERDVWSRWKAGQSLHEIGRALDKPPSCIRSVLLPRGGIPPAAGRRSRLALTLAEREDISRGIASDWPLREIARRLDRAASTVSREISQAQLDQVALRLNQRPRKTLGFETPASKLQASVASTI